MNHRLNILGFFVAEIGGYAYEDSVNVGMTDLVAALKWVQENIENLGGDPNRVMIYGQSGGGSKVTTLMGMPSAVVLIHRVAAQSGGGGNIPSRDQQKELSRQVMKELGLAVNDIGSLQKMDWAKLFAAGNAAAAITDPGSWAVHTPIPEYRHAGNFPSKSNVARGSPRPFTHELLRGRPLSTRDLDPATKLKETSRFELSRCSEREGRPFTALSPDLEDSAKDV